MDRSFESILASFAPPVVGILAQHVYGYKPVTIGSSDAESIETDRENAASLAKALYTAMGIPFTVCCFIYSFLYCTYPRDRERARMHALIETEIQLMEDGVIPPSAEESALRFSDSSDMGLKDRSVISIEYGGDQDLEFEENEQNNLLSSQVPLSNFRTPM